MKVKVHRGRAGHRRKEGLILKKKNPRECRCCWTEGREVRFRFQPDGGSGGRTLLHEYTKIHTGAGGHKTAVLALTRWVQSSSRGPALDST